MTNTPDNAKLRKFITTYFNEEELDTFCFDYFWEVEFAKSMTPTERAKALISYCRRRDLIPKLLENLAKERSQPFQTTFGVQTQLQKTRASKATSRQKDSFIHEKTGLEFVRIPAGDFLYGDGELKTIYLPEYWISKTPVTQRIYQKFVTEKPGGYPVPYSTNSDREKPYNWNRRKKTFPTDKPDHPVVLISWHDAVAFCEWAKLRLPTGQEWEKGARSDDGRMYPWGNKWRESHCNIEETGLGGTSFVGKFSPQGDSLYGCVDMIGNVWEWTASLALDPDVVRGVRGGSWYSEKDWAYCGCNRNSGHYETTSIDVGFRCCFSMFPFSD